jgi:uncharacterized protein YndB with AHSA1/START domain
MAEHLDDLIATTTVPLELDAAFDLFTAGFGTWWPREFSWSGPELLEEIGMQERDGGFVYEQGPGGFHLDFGQILAWTPPRRVLFTWQIGPDRVPVPDRGKASEVDATFGAVDEGTLITVTHGKWERHGEGAEAYREQFADVWPYALGNLAKLR